MRKKVTLALIIALAFFAGLSLAISNLEKAKRDLPGRQNELFTDTLAVIETDYVDEVKPKALIYGALKGMLSSLDAHSQFMNPQDYQELKTETTGTFSGLGVEITIKDGLITVITPIEGTPAWKAGLKPGDQIIKINDELTRNMDLDAAVKKIRGTPGGSVSITVLRGPEQKALEFKIVREIIKIKDVKEAKILEDGIGYIRLVEFRENTARDVFASLDRLLRQGMHSLILDLRNNPGGLLESAIAVAGKFMPEGEVIAYTRSRKKEQDLTFIAQDKNPLLNLPIVVLINGGSASGSEIIAAAMQDAQRGVVLGVKSFGKGSVQSVIPLSDGSGLRLTTSRYFTPSGRQIHAKGVIPDIIIEDGLGKDQPDGQLSAAIDYLKDSNTADLELVKK